MVGKDEGKSRQTTVSSLSRSIIFSDSIDLNQISQQMVQNFPQLPLSQRQLEELYSRYINWNKIIDDELMILEILNKKNQSAVLDSFGEWVRGLLKKLRSLHDSEQGMRLDVKQLEKVLIENFPLVVLNEKQSQQQQIITKTIISNTISQKHLQKVSFNNTQMVIFNNFQQRTNLVFGIMQKYMHGIIIKYKKYYSVEDAQLLERTVSECLKQFTENNRQSELMKERFQQKQPSQLQSKKRRLLDYFAEKISFNIQNPKQVQQQEKKVIKQQKQKKSIIKQSTAVDQFIDFLVKWAEDKQMIKKIGQQHYQQQQNKDQNNPLQIKNYEINPVKIIQNGSSLLPSLATKSLAKIFAKKINSFRDKSVKYEQITQQEQQKVMQLAQTILKSHIRHNVQKQDGLDPEQFIKVEEFIKNYKHQQYTIDSIRSIFTQNQKQLLIEILYSVKRQLVEQNCSQLNIVVAKLKRFVNEFSILQAKLSKLTVKKGITTTLLSKVKFDNKKIYFPNVFYFLLVLYGHFEQTYCPLTRRTLLKICHQIELRFNEFVRNEEDNKKRFSLVHTLKLLQSQNIRRSSICSIITNQKPFRQTQLPLVNEKEEYFEEDNKQKIYSCGEAQKYLQQQINQLHILSFNKYYKDPPKIQLLKLSHSKHKKNITILISGFLSQDTNKFEEWMGVLESTYDSEIYALKWQSKTMEHLLEYIIETCRDLAFTGTGFGLLGGPYVRAAMIFKQIFTKYHQNPFKPCFEIATITGIYFAQLIMNLFNNHFINLIGFSLGTQVILSTLEQFKKKGKLHMINRIITMGGVADKDQLINLFESQQQSDQNPISISWTNVYCETDNILRYLLKISLPSIDPIGTKEVRYPEVHRKPYEKKQSSKMQNENELQKMDLQMIQKKKVYQIENLNVTEFVDGHLSYRTNMRNIARLLGVKDQ